MENAAGLLCREADRVLTGWQEALSKVTQDMSSGLPPGASVFWRDSQGICRRGGARLPFCPAAPRSDEPAPALFAKAEELEFRQGNASRAAAGYRLLAGASDARVRAGALMGLARCLRKQGKLEEALGTYAVLSTLGETPVAGSPAELLARGERIRLFQAAGNESARAREEDLLGVILDASRYAIDGSTFDFYRQLLPAASSWKASSFARAAALQASWTDLATTSEPASGRRVWPGRADLTSAP